MGAGQYFLLPVVCTDTMPYRGVCQCRSDDAAEGSRGAEPGQVPDSLPLASAGTDWREFRAQLVANAAQQQREQQQSDGGGPGPAPRGASLDPGGGVWAHPIPQPEKGCLLIAHPLMFTSTQIYFSQVRE